MLKRKIYLVFLSVTIFFLFTSCDFLLNLFKTENPEYEIGKFEDINIFDKSNLSEENSFVTGYSITGDNEYLYAATSDCWGTAGSSYNSSCAAKDWLYSTVTNNTGSNAWTITPTNSGGLATGIVNNGSIGTSTISNSAAASPVVYLKSTVKITGGNGKIGQTNSYKLGLQIKRYSN